MMNLNTLELLALYPIFRVRVIYLSPGLSRA